MGTDKGGKYKVHLGGRDRGLRYTYADRVQLEKMWKRPDGTPVDFPGLIQGHLIGSGSFEVQMAVLWAGLHRVDSRITIEKTTAWVIEHIESDGTPGVILRPVINAIFESGVLGVKSDQILGDPEEGPENEEQAGPKEAPG